MEKSPVKNTLRLQDRELQRVLDILQKENSVSSASSKRGTKRWVCAYQKMVITTQDTHGNLTHTNAVPRNISTGGIAFINGGFLHPGSGCVVVLRTKNGLAKKLQGKVVRCIHIASHLHEVAIAFEETIDPTHFQVVQDGQDHFNIEHFLPTDLKGTVLIISGSREQEKAIARFFLGTNTDLLAASNMENALPQLQEYPDLVVVEQELGEDKTGIEFITEQRNRGYLMPTILLSSNREDEFRTAALTAGATEVLFKPFPPELLRRAAAEYLIISGRDKQDMSIHTASVSPDRYSAALDEIDTLQMQADELAAALGDRDIQRIRQITSEISAIGHGFGWRAISDRSSELLNDDEGATLDWNRTQLTKRVLEACRLARPPATPAE